MKRLMIIASLIGILCIGLIPVSAKSILPKQSELPIPQGFCVQLTVPIYDEGIVVEMIGNSIFFIPIHADFFFSEDLNGDVYELTGWVFTDEVSVVVSEGLGIDDFSGAAIDALHGLIETIGSGNVVILPASACSFPAYRDNAALGQAFLVPETGYDVYQIFDGNGIFSFRVTQDALANAEAGDVLGSNEAGNITFAYNGNGQCTVTYPYPDGKMGSSTFTCQGKITDWGRIPPYPNVILVPLSE